MRVFYAQDQFPKKITLTLFLLGPTSRAHDGGGESWRVEALSILQDLGFGGEVFVPEPRDGRWTDDYTKQVAWEEEALHRSDRILVWLPRDMRSLPGLTTNDEWGFWKGRDPSRLIFGAPPSAPKVRYQQYYAKQLGIPVFSTLMDVCRAAIVDPGEMREGAECQVPVHVWRTQAFRRWYAVHKQAGNTLCGARVEWVFRLAARPVFYWALRADLYVAAESRHKSNEVVLGRPDIAAAVLYSVSPTLLETKVVLVREFRSASRTPDGFVMELPCGSANDGDEDPITLAVAEVQEETGLALDAGIFYRHKPRQLVGPLNVYQAFVFSAELSQDAIAAIRTREAAKGSFGVAAETEKTYPCVRTVREVLEDPAVDWSTLGMILSVLQDRLQIAVDHR